MSSTDLDSRTPPYDSLTGNPSEEFCQKGRHQVKRLVLTNQHKSEILHWRKPRRPVVRAGALTIAVALCQILRLREKLSPPQ
jgi:hypothetical protein